MDINHQKTAYVGFDPDALLLSVNRLSSFNSMVVGSIGTDAQWNDSLCRFDVLPNSVLGRLKDSITPHLLCTDWSEGVKGATT